MSHTPHELAAEFPDNVRELHALKTQDAHFSRISAEYHEINREIHRIETQVEAASDERLEDLKKQRVLLKDEVANLLENSEIAGT